MNNKIFVVDDEYGIRELYCNALTKAGYNVTTVLNGKEAIELVRNQEPDLILLDYNMPHMNGVEVIKNIKIFNTKTKIVMLTSIGSEELEKEARLAGASGFFRKNLGITVIIKATNEMFQIKKEYDKKKILVVDDDPSILSLIRDFLLKKGFNVITTTSGEKALEKIKEEKPILVLLDINLVGMDGILTLKRIKEIDDKIGVIMITGEKDHKTFEEAMSLGADEYIIKPFDLNYLDNCVLVRICLISAALNS